MSAASAPSSVPSAPRKLRAVFFDLDDTLCDDASAWVRCALLAAKLAAKSGVAVDERNLADSFLNISRRYWSSPECKRETRPLHAVRAEQWLEALRGVGLAGRAALAEVLAAEYGRLRTTQIAVFPDAIPTLEALRARGLQLALITNGFRSTHIEKIAHLGLDRHFDHVLIAEIVGCFKPDARIFRTALELCGCAANEAAMVGDDPVNDIAGAEAVGIRSFWFNPRGVTLPDGIAPASGGAIASLADLPFVLG